MLMLTALSFSMLVGILFENLHAQVVLGILLSHSKFV